MKKLIIKSFLIIATLLISCSGGNDNSVSEENNVPEPEAAILSNPANNSECLEVEAVKFDWNTSKNTTSYDIVVKNLSNDVIISQTTTTNSVEISLEKGFPYSWQIISKNEGSVTKTSSTWKFYLSGTPLENHAPFPAEIITPKPGETIIKGNIELSWKFSDVDSSDTHTFEIYLDTQNASTKIESDYSTTKKSISLNQAGIYYWKIITKDNHGSSSDSGISSFILID